MTQRQLTLSDYKIMLRRHWVLIAFLAVLGGPLGYGVARAIPNHYTSTETILVEPPTVSADIVKPVLTNELGQQLASMNAQILSRSSLEQIIRDFNLYPKDVNRLPMDELVERLHDSIEVSALKEMEETKAQGLPGFTVSVTLDDPTTARDVCSRLTSLFIKTASNSRQEKSQDTTQFLDGQLADAKAKLDQQGELVADFKRKHLGSLPEDQTANSNELASLNVQLSSITQALTGAQQERSFDEGMLNDQRSAWEATQTGDNPAALENQLEKLQSDLADLQSSGYTDSYPNVIQKKNEIAQMQKKIAGAGKASKPQATAVGARPLNEPPQIQQWEAKLNADDKTIAEKKKQRDDVTQQIKDCEAKMRLSPAVQQQYEELTRGATIANENYQNLLKDKNDSAMATALEKRQEGETFSVLDAANLPDKPSFPSPPLFTGAGFLLGLSLGLGLTYLIEIQDTSMRSERDVETLLRLPVLAMIPPVEAVQGKKSKLALRAPTSGGQAGART